MGIKADDTADDCRLRSEGERRLDLSTKVILGTLAAIFIVRTTRHDRKAIYRCAANIVPLTPAAHPERLVP